MYTAWQVFIVSYVAVFAFEIFWFWWDGWSLASFCNLNENESHTSLEKEMKLLTLWASYSHR